MMKRLLSLFLAMAMVLSMVPSQVLAQEIPGEPAPPAEETQETVLETEAPAEETEAPSEEPEAPAEEPLLSQEPSLTAEESTDIASGTCGFNLTWVITQQGTLTISGTGLMDFTSYTNDVPPWKEYRSQITAIVIEEGVTSIGPSAFASLDYVVSVTIPSTVQSIAARAFQRCDMLTQVVIPEGVTGLNEYCFGGCASLVKVTLPSTLVNIGEYAFQGCESLASITLPEGLVTIGEGAFYSCDSLARIVMPDTVTTLGIKAFSECRSMVSATLSQGLTRIPERAFYCCDKLTSITVPDNVLAIGSYAFYQCFALTRAVIGASVTQIDNNAFRACKALTSVTLPDGLISIGDYTFYECKALTAVTLPDSLSTLGGSAFRDCSAMARLTLSQGLTVINEAAFNGCSSLTSVTIPDSVSVIDGGAFGGCEKLTTLTLPDGLISIGDTAFNGCSSLRQVTLPEGLSTLGGSAFKGCSSLKSIVLPDSLVTLGASTFWGCSSLTSAVVGNYTTNLPNSFFRDCTALAELTLGESITGIGEYALYNCEALGKVTIPAGVVTIDNYGFGNCDALTEIVFTGDAPVIEKDAFYHVTATAYYPRDNATWTADVLQNYGGTITWLMEGTQAGAGDAVLNGITLDEYVLNAGDTVTATLDIVGEAPYTVIFTLYNLATKAQTTIEAENEALVELPFPAGGNYLVIADLVNGQGDTSYASDRTVVSVYDGSPYIQRVEAETALAGQSFSITPVLSGPESRVQSLTWQLHRYQEGTAPAPMGEAITNPDARTQSFTIDEPGQYNITIVTKTDTGASYFFDYWFQVAQGSTEPGTGDAVLLGAVLDQGNGMYLGGSMSVVLDIAGEGSYTVTHELRDYFTGEVLETVVVENQAAYRIAFTTPGTHHMDITLTNGSGEQSCCYGNLVYIYDDGPHIEMVEPIFARAGEPFTVIPVMAGDESRVVSMTWELYRFVDGEGVFLLGEPAAYEGYSTGTYTVDEPGVYFVSIQTHTDTGALYVDDFWFDVYEPGQGGILSSLWADRDFCGLGETVTVYSEFEGGAPEEAAWIVKHSEDGTEESYEEVARYLWTEDTNTFTLDRGGFWRIELVSGSSSRYVDVYVYRGLYLTGTNWNLWEPGPGDELILEPSCEGTGAVRSLTYQMYSEDWEPIGEPLTYDSLVPFSYVGKANESFSLEITLVNDLGEESRICPYVEFGDGSFGVTEVALTDYRYYYTLGESVQAEATVAGTGGWTEANWVVLWCPEENAWDQRVIEASFPYTGENTFSYTPQREGVYTYSLEITSDTGRFSGRGVQFVVQSNTLRIRELTYPGWPPFSSGDVVEITPVFSGEGEVASGTYTIEINGEVTERIPYEPGTLNYKITKLGQILVTLDITNTEGNTSSAQCSFFADDLEILDMQLDPMDGTPGEQTLTIITKDGTIEWMEVSVYEACFDFETGYSNADYSNPLLTLAVEGNTATFQLEETGQYMVQAYVRSNNQVYHGYGKTLSIHGEGTYLDHVDVTPKAAQVGETVTITPVVEGDEAVVGTHYVVWLLEGQQASKLADSLEFAERYGFVPQKAGGYFAEVYVKLESGQVWYASAGFTVGQTEPAEPQSIDLVMHGEIVNGLEWTWDMAESDTAWLWAEVLPYGADQEVVWSTSSKSVATVDDGTVTFLKPGTVKITAASAQDSSVKATVEFNVVFKDAAKKFTGKLAPETNLYGSPSKSGVQVGDSVNVLVFGTDKEVPLEGLTYEFTSDSYYDYADLDSETGEVTALAAGKTVKVKAYFEGDPLKRSVTVSVKTLATIPGSLNLVYDQDAEYCSGQDCGIDGCGCLLNPGMDNGVLVALSDNGGAYELELTLTALDQLGRPMEDAGAVTWTSSNTKLATVKNGVLTVKKGAQGTVTITAKSKLDRSLTAALVVELRNYAPQMADTSLTINTFLEGSYSLGIQEHAADPVVDVQLTDKNGVPMEDFEFAWEDGDWVIQDPGMALDNGTTKGILNVFTAHGIAYGYSFSVKVANKAPTVTLKTTRKLNLKDENGYAEVTVTCKQGAVEGFWLSEDMELLASDPVDNVIRLDYMHDVSAVPSPDVSGKATIRIAGYREEAEVVKTLKVSTEKVNNKAVLGDKTITLYRELPDAEAATSLTSYWDGLEVEDVELTTTNAQGRKISVVCENGIITAGFLDAEDLPKAGSYKFTAKPVIDGKEMAKITLTVKVAAQPKTTVSPTTAKLSAAENLPAQVAVTPAAPGFEGFREITEGTCTYAEDIVLEYENGVITVYLSDDFDLKTGKTYSIKLTPVYDGVEMTQITLKVNIRK